MILPMIRQCLEVSAEVMEIVPVPGLAEAVRLLLDIWDACEQVGVCGHLFSCSSHYLTSLLLRSSLFLPSWALNGPCRLLGMECLHGVQENQLLCLRLTRRCTAMVFCIHREIVEAGEAVEQELSQPLKQLCHTLKQVSCSPGKEMMPR